MDIHIQYPWISAGVGGFGETISENIGMDWTGLKNEKSICLQIGIFVFDFGKDRMMETSTRGILLPTIFMYLPISS